MTLKVLPVVNDHAHPAATAGKCLTPVTVGDLLYEISPAEFSGNVAMVTLGCAKNLVDSEVMLGAFVKRGFRPVTEPENAEIIVVNTCAFLQSAVEEGIDRVLEMTRFKREGRCRKLIVAGCMVERYRTELAKNFPEVDRFVSTDELLSVADEDGDSSLALDEARRPYFLYDETTPRVLSTGKHSCYVKIAEGCDRPCTFCIIPKIRGAFRSRPLESVLAEVRSLSGAGVKELNFVAQDLTAYGTDFPGNRGIRSELSTLLSAITEMVPQDSQLWIRLLYAYPINTDETLIRTIVESPVICNYLDIPLQHISGALLKRMRRPLGERGTRELVAKIREIAPELAIRTTFIVGFPGETAEDVEALRSFVAEGYFTHVGVFTYSDEEEAAANEYPDRVPAAEKEERRALIMETQQRIVAARLQSLIGTRQRVLIDGAHSDTDLLFVARAEWQAPETDGEVIINEIDEQILESHPDNFIQTLTGRFGIVEYTEVQGYDLVGTLVELQP